MGRIWVECLVVCVFILGQPVHGGIEAKDGEFGMDLGFTESDPEVSNNDGFSFGFRGGYHFTKFFQLEGQLFFVSLSDSPISILMLSAMVNGVVNFQASRTVVPYVMGGVGVARLEYSESVTEFSLADSGPAYQFALGSRFFVGKKKKTAIRVEVSWFTEDTFDESSRHTNYLVGVTWIFRKSASAPASD